MKEKYVYQMSYKGDIYISKRFKIHLEHPNPKDKTSLIQISEVFQEYYFARVASSLNPHIAAPLFMDFTVDLAEDKMSYSYIHIEIIFEHGGTSLSSMQSTTLELTYNLIRQSANALFQLDNRRKDLLKITGMGSIFG